MKYRGLKLLLLLGIGFFGCLQAEQVKIVGDYVTPGDVNGDLIVVNGSVNVIGDLNVNGDLKVTAGKVGLSGGNLQINGDLIVTNTKLDVTPANQDATVTVSGELYVNGAVVTKSTYGDAYVETWDALTTGVGSLRAGRISTWGYTDAHVIADHHMTVTGSIVTRSETGLAFVRSNGITPPYGDIYAGSIYTYGINDDAYVHVEDGHLTVNGPIVTRGKLDSYVLAEGNIEAGSIFTHSDELDAYISGEKVNVIGDIRTLALAGNAYVRARRTVLGGQEGTFEDIIANNIYTRGYLSARVRAFRSIQVRGDIVTWETEGVGRESGSMIGAGVSTGDITGRGRNISIKKDQQDISYDRGVSRAPIAFKGNIEAQNIVTRGQNDASVEAYGSILVNGDIITKSDYYGYVWADYGDIKAGNISTEGIRNAYIVTENGDILVDYVLSTTNPDSIEGRQPITTAGRSYISADYGFVEAEKIFTYGDYSSTVIGRYGVNVNGPVRTLCVSDGNACGIYAPYGDISAGLVFAEGGEDASVRTFEGYINVREDIRLKAAEPIFSGAYVDTVGKINARSIKIVADSDNHIEAGSSSDSKYQFLFDEKDVDIYNGEIDLDSDYDWKKVLTLIGTVTLNGKGHCINLIDSGQIRVFGSTTVTFKNVHFRNVSGTNIRCINDTGVIKLQDVIWEQDGDYQFANGKMQLLGDLTIRGTGTTFSYESSEQSSVGQNATLRVDRGAIFKYNTTGNDRIIFTDESSRIHFDGSKLLATQSINLSKGTLATDNIVTFLAESGKAISFGGGGAANNLNFDFGGASKLVRYGTVNNNNS